MSSIASPHPSSSVTRSLCGTGNTQLDCQQSPFGNTGSTWTHLRPAPPRYTVCFLLPASCAMSCHALRHHLLVERPYYYCYYSY